MKDHQGFNIVLVEPEIPQNTGSIGRLCLATQSTLHLIEPFGFQMTDAHLRRAGLDYWQHVQIRKYANLNYFLNTMPIDEKIYFFSKHASATLFETQFQSGSYLVFGKETAGLPAWLREVYKNYWVRIPIYDARVRSLNLANAVSIAVYEAIRQLQA